MSSFDWGAIIAAGIGLLIWNISQELRIRNLNGKLVVSEQKVQDAEILSNVHKLTSDALALAIDKELGGDSQKPTTEPVPEPGSTGKN